MWIRKVNSSNSNQGLIQWLDQLGTAGRHDGRYNQFEGPAPLNNDYSQGDGFYNWINRVKG